MSTEQDYRDAKKRWDEEGKADKAKTPGSFAQRARRLLKRLHPPESDAPRNNFALAEVTVAVPEARQNRWIDGWSRTEEYMTRRAVSALELGVDIVLRGLPAVFGETKGGFDSYFEGPRVVAVNRFGSIQTVDRREIEEFSSVRNILLKYLWDKEWREPLAIAVFGPPGSGKSFAVKQILASIRGASTDEPLEFNVSQFADLRDLAAAFHRVQDRGLAGSSRAGDVPLIFFDEFDCGFENRELGFLKYFLGPMQDGKFKDGSHQYRIGKSIFVFAGGVSHTFDEFSRWRGQAGEFAAAKGPDFISRLRGHLDISGPNPTRRGEKVDDNLIIRRAVLLRQLLELYTKEVIGEPTKVANVDTDIIRAFLTISRYEHGVRSMQAIIQMTSPLKSGCGFQKSYLPSPDQLAMHVDAPKFLRLLHDQAH